MSSIEIQLVKGDITQIEVDAIVNAANEKLVGGGGVDGAIHKRGGPSIMNECNDIRKLSGGCPTGLAVVTTAGNLPAIKVIHTVGPVWQGGNSNEAELLESSYLSCLQIANDNTLEVVSFPGISTGVYGYPKEKAALIAINTVRKFNPEKMNIKRILFVCFDYELFNIYKTLLK